MPSLTTPTAPPATLSTLTLDIEDDTSIAAAVASVTSTFGRLDILINNAGTAAPALSGRAKLTSIFSTNVISTMLVTEAFTPLLLLSARPYLIEVSSGLGSVGLAADPSSELSIPAWVEYRMSKAALNMMTVQMAKGLGEKGVKVFAFCPGLVRSNLRGEGEENVSAWGRAGDPMVSGKGILDIVLGKRDEDVGKFVWVEGVYPW